MLQFNIPPLPHYIIGGEDTYSVGAVHPSRSNIGVFDLIHVTRGCLYITENGKPYEISAGRTLILSPDGVHYSTIPCNEETHFYWLHFQSCGTYRNVEEVDLQDRPLEPASYAKINQFLMYLPLLTAVPDRDEMTQSIKKIIALNEDKSGIAGLKQQELFVSLLVKLNEKVDTEKFNRVYVIAEKAAEYIRQNSIKGLTYGRMSKELHFHENYISQCMKRTFGFTPLEYLTYYRLERGKHFIIHTDLPIAVIAEQIGFNSVSYFLRRFSKCYGISPGAFRQQYRVKIDCDYKRV